MLQNIIFDYDGVLVDSEILAGRAFTQYLSTRNIHLTEQEFINSYTGDKTIDVITKLSSKFNLGNQKVFFDEFMQILNNTNLNELEAISGVHSFLDNIQQKKFIGSNNIKERIMYGLKKVDLNKYFDESNIFCFNMIKNPKPAPDVFLKVVEVTGIQPKNTIIIEDSVIGTTAGVNANIKVIGFTAGGHWKGRNSQSLIKAGACTVAANYIELLKIIKELE